MDNLALGSLNTIDVILLLTVLLSMIIGMVRGFVKEALSLMTWIAATVVSALYFQQVGDTYLAGIQVLMLRYLFSGILLSLGTLIIGGILNYLISSLIKKTGFHLPDRIIGAFFGLTRGVFLSIVAVLIGLSFEKLQTPTWRESVLIPHLVPAAHWLKDRIHVPEKLKEALDASSGLVNNKQQSSATAATVAPPAGIANILDQTGLTPAAEGHPSP